MKFTKPCYTQAERQAAKRRHSRTPKPYLVWGILKNGAVDETCDDQIKALERLAICLEYQAEPGDVYEICRIECVPRVRRRPALPVRESKSARKPGVRVVSA